MNIILPFQRLLAKEAVTAYRDGLSVLESAFSSVKTKNKKLEKGELKSQQKLMDEIRNSSGERFTVLLDTFLGVLHSINGIFHTQHQMMLAQAENQV